MVKQRITMADIAEAVQVSKMTVSRVLNNKPGVSDDTRRRILGVAEKLGYTPHAQQGGDADSNIIALVIPNQVNAYMSEILRGVSNAVEQFGCDVMLYTQPMFTNPDKLNSLSSPLRNGLIDGVVMVVPVNYEEMVKHIKELELPVVIIDHHSETANEASVTATNRKGMLEATRYLLALGHRRIGFITGRMDIACSHDRLRGYRDGLEEVGLQFDQKLVCQGDYLQPSGYEATRCLLSLDTPPTALLVSNDMMAYGAMEAIRNAGFTVGSDISVIGFDDIFMSSLTYPPLTTVRQPLEEMGEVAIDMLTDLIQGRTILNLHRELATELIVRETTGRVRD